MRDKRWSWFLFLPWTLCLVHCTPMVPNQANDADVTHDAGTTEPAESQTGDAGERDTQEPKQHKEQERSEPATPDQRPPESNSLEPAEEQTTLVEDVGSLTSIRDPQCSEGFYGSGGGDLEQAGGVAPLSDGGIVIVGSYYEKTRAGSHTFTSRGKSDIIVKRIGPKGQIKWALSMGSIGYDHGSAITTTSSGDIYVAGYFCYGWTLFNKRNLPACQGFFGERTLKDASLNSPVLRYKFFLARISPDGKVAWVRSTESHEYGEIKALATSGGLVTQVGNFEKARIKQIDASGASRWSDSVLGDSAATAITYNAASKTFVVTGSFKGSIRTSDKEFISKGGKDVFVLAYDLGGKLQWLRTVGGSGDDVANAIAVDKDGNIALTGSFKQELPWDETQQSKGMKDAFVALLDAKGTHKWVKAFSSAHIIEGTAAHFTANGDLWVAGDFFGSASLGKYTLESKGSGDIYLARLSNTGAIEHIEKIGCTGLDLSKGIVGSKAGSLWLFGSYEHPNGSKSSDFLLYRF